MKTELVLVSELNDAKIVVRKPYHVFRRIPTRLTAPQQPEGACLLCGAVWDEWEMRVIGRLESETSSARAERGASVCREDALAVLEVMSS